MAAQFFSAKMVRPLPDEKLSIQHLVTYGTEFLAN